MDKDINKWTFLRVFIWFLTWFVVGFLTFSLKTEIDSQRLKETSWKVSNVEEQTLQKDLDMSDFWYVYSIIKDKYIWIDSIKKEDVVNSAISWMVKWLWDKHSEYLYWEELNSFESSLNWNFEWIWAYVSKNEMWIVIEKIIAWSPAKKYWILRWDIILEADWVDLSKLDKYDAISKIKWPAWSKVILSVYREWEWIIEKEVTRNYVKIPSVSYENFDWLWYIQISTYWETTFREFQDSIDSAFNDNVDWLIIDLRDNGWGYLKVAVDILSYFIEEWKNLVTVKAKDSFFNLDDKHLSANYSKIFDKPILVLINGSSASASEITAWALQDYSKAIIVWEQSYWKWSVQTPFNLKNWNMLKITTSKWYTPNNNTIEWKWITPDIKVEFDIEEAKKWVDNQLEKSKQILKFLINNDLSKTVSEFNK